VKGWESGDGKVKVEGVEGVKGEAYLLLVKNKVRLGYTLKFKVKYSGMVSPL